MERDWLCWMVLEDRRARRETPNAPVDPLMMGLLRQISPGQWNSRQVLALCSELLLGGRMHNDPDPTASIQSETQIDGRYHILIL